MRRIVLTLLAAMCFLTGSACGTRRDQQADPGDEDLIVIGMCQVGAESDWRVANSESMKESNGMKSREK